MKAASPKVAKPFAKEKDETHLVSPCVSEYRRQGVHKAVDFGLGVCPKLVCVFFSGVCFS